jgi:hypothetical protein
MKIVGLAVVRTGAELNEPIPLSVATDLSSFGFFQRQVRTGTVSFCRFFESLVVTMRVFLFCFVLFCLVFYSGTKGNLHQNDDDTTTTKPFSYEIDHPTHLSQNRRRIRFERNNNNTSS